MVSCIFMPKTLLEKTAFRATRWIGSIESIIVHTVIFVVAFVLMFFGVSVDRVLLVVTTIVSLEAIYLAIFIQMSVNRSERRIWNVSKEIHEISEDVQEIEKDIDEIQKDVEGIEKDIDEIQEDVEEIEKETEDQHQERSLDEIQKTLEGLIKKINELQK